MAFSSDPACRWLYPDPHQYLHWFPRFVDVFGGGAFEQGAAHCTDPIAGAALWYPPGVHPDDDAVGAVLEESIAPAYRDRVFPLFEEMDRVHPSEPHWYLPLLGVDPAHQGRGYGSALLSFALERCDREGMPAYLEATCARNASLYRRHGFEPVGEIPFRDGGALIPMWRDPR